MIRNFYGLITTMQFFNYMPFYDRNSSGSRGLMKKKLIVSNQTIFKRQIFLLLKIDLLTTQNLLFNESSSVNDII